MATVKVALSLFGPCNYRCYYCQGDRPGNKGRTPKLHDIVELEHIYELLGPDVYTSLYARGTEPALHPQMARIAEIVARKGSFRILTNLSRSVRDWLPGPRNLILLVTIHPEAEEDSAGFFGRVREANEDGYDVRVQGLGDRDWAKWQVKLERIGLSLQVRPIRPPTKEKMRTAPLPPAAPPGSLCRAGYDACMIAYGSEFGTTRLLRCQVRRLPIGALSAEPMPCQVPHADPRCREELVAT